jgi:hypothetical protein
MRNSLRGALSALALGCLFACDDSSPTQPTPSPTPAVATPAPPPPTSPPPVAVNQPPVPAFRVTPFPAEGPAPLAVNFNLCPTADPEGDAILFVFDFGDGAVTQGPPCRLRHVYAPGRFTARMCVWDLRADHALVCETYFVKAQ